MRQTSRIAAVLATGLLIWPGFSGCSDDASANDPDNSGANRETAEKLQAAGLYPAKCK